MAERILSRGAFQGGAKSTRRHRAELRFAGDDGDVRYGGPHKDELDLQAFLLVVTFIDAGIEGDLGDTRSGNRHPRHARLCSQAEAGQKK